MYYLKKKKKGKQLSTLVDKLDKVFSEFIRLRDSKAYGYKYFKCISCGRIKPFDQCDCGHFVGRTHMATRFDEKNCHGECRHCNRFSPDHIIYYQRNLIERYGQGAVDELIARGKTTKKWSQWELEILIAHYKEEIKKMKDAAQ